MITFSRKQKGAVRQAVVIAFREVWDDPNWHLLPRYERYRYLRDRLRAAIRALPEREGLARRISRWLMG